MKPSFGSLSPFPPPRHWIHVWLLLAVSPAMSSAADYYLSPSGKDTNPGTQALPWQTVARVNATKFLPGDRILFEGGKTFQGSVDMLDEEGTPALPITISSYGAGRATLNALNRYGIYIYNALGFSISNLNIVGSGAATNEGSGIVLYADLAQKVTLSYLRIDSVDISGFGVRNEGGWVNPCRGWGIAIMADAPGGAVTYNDIRITNVTAHSNAAGGITTLPRWEAYPPGPPLTFTNVYVGRSKTYNNPGIPGLGNHSGNGILLQGVDGAIIEHNVAYNNGYLSDSTAGGPVGIWVSVANNVLIQYNESYANRTKGPHDGGGFDLDGGVTNSVMQYNYSHDNDGAGFLMGQYAGVRAWSGNTVRYNISQNDARKNSYGAIMMWNGGSGLVNTKIYNNTVFISTAPTGIPSALRLMSPTKDTTIRNNLFLTSGTARAADVVAGQSNLVLQGNNYWSYSGPVEIRWAGAIYKSFYTWLAASGQEKLNGMPTGFNVDPQVTNVGAAPALNDTSLLAAMPAYRLGPNSAIADKGLDLRSFGIDPGTRDFFGAALPQGSSVDVGAHERAGDSVPPASRVTGISLTPGSGSVVVSWIGTDNAGISSYTIYISKDGGPFTPWLSNTTQTVAPFAGTAGSSYRFFSIATDISGNIELLKNSGEATIAVGASSYTCPTQ